MIIIYNYNDNKNVCIVGKILKLDERHSSPKIEVSRIFLLTTLLMEALMTFHNPTGASQKKKKKKPPLDKTTGACRGRVRH